MNDEENAEEFEEQLDDVSEALESTGMVESEAEGEEAEQEDGSALPGPIQAIEQLQGSGKDIEAYEGTPIAEAVGPEGSKGALHIARGIDGLSPLGAMNPLVDIGIGFVLLQLEKSDSDEPAETDEMKVERDESEPGYDRMTGEGDDLS